MRVLCAYTVLHPPVVAALARHAPGAELVPVAGDPGGYWRALRDRWGDPAGLATVEHDVEIHAGVMTGFACCPEPWCVYPYLTSPGEYLARGLGCTRFRPAAMTAAPPAAAGAVPGSCWECQGRPGAGCWRHLDGQIAAALETAGLAAHVHWPAVRHHNPAAGEA